MKNVTIIYNNREYYEAIIQIEQSLKKVFENYINFTNFFLCENKDSNKLHDDAYIVTSDFMYYEARKYVDDFSKIIRLSRSINKDMLLLISKIPSKTKVLVVGDTYENTLQITYSFYEIGFGHINFIPYDATLEHTNIYRDISVAITPSIRDRVPEYINNIVDIGYREVSSETMFNIIHKLNLDIDKIYRNLNRHIHSVIEPNTYFHLAYMNTFLKSQMLNQIVGNDDIGALLVDSNYHPIYSNNKANLIFKVEDYSMIKINKYLDDNILRTENIINEPITIMGQEFLYDKHILYFLDEIAGYYITLQDKKLAKVNNLTLKHNGFFAKHQFKDIIYASNDMQAIINTAKKMALTDHTVLIIGKSGTGKELFAQSMHNYSKRRRYPFVAVNCATLPESLLESELFGYESGSFTGASKKGKLGLFEQAQHGTVFLDEIGDLTPKLQARLLRAIQEKQIMRIGSDKIIDVDIRIFAATNKDLEKAVEEGTFRADLFYRLNVLSLELPPLNNRKNDIHELLKQFLGRSYKNISTNELDQLLDYEWPGNVRELRNAALYYKTLLKFPKYLYKRKSKNDNNYSMYKYNSDQVLTNLVMQIIKDNTQPCHGVGRSNIVHILKSSGYIISDGKLRDLLKKLQEKGFVVIGSGRYGTRITESGITYIENCNRGLET